MAFRIWLSLCKLVQRRTYTCLSTRHGLWFAFLGICIILVSAFHFGEILIEWSMIQSTKLQFGKYYDNIAYTSYENRLCMPQPIDVVYTWVNGSDSKLIMQINAVKKKLEAELNITEQENYQFKKSRNKLINSDRFKWKNVSVCPVPNCVSTNKLAITGLPRNIVLGQLLTVNEVFVDATEITFWDDELDVAFITFKNRQSLNKALQIKIKYKYQLLNTSEIFYTSTVRSGHRRVENVLMVYNHEKKFNKSSLEEKINQKFENSLASLDNYDNDTLFILHFKDEKYVTTLLSLNKKRLKTFKINSYPVKFFPVTYIWKPLLNNYDSESDDISQNRFADNNELKYSLRSVEKFAPWVRNIYIVTNGQIPSWLDLDNPRVQIVTHKEIFKNKSHLPTFSSPSIETHIHRIPGLSKKFIYMNDDVFFGAEVWPDDFMTYSNGQKVFLTWAVPNCNIGCPASWINDKYCDKACNVSSCDWDGGDCLGAKAQVPWQLGAQHMGHASTTLGENCAPGCANNWMGDRYCDGNCNNALCGYDAGDCGLEKLKKLHSITIFDNTSALIKTPKGTVAFYVNLTNVFPGGLLEGNHDDSKCLRTAVLSKHYNVLFISLYNNISLCNTSFEVLGYGGFNNTKKSVVRYNVTSNTVLETSVSTIRNITLLNPNNTRIEIIIPDTLYNSSQHYQSKNAIRIKTTDSIIKEIDFDELINMSLPNDMKSKLEELKKEFTDELLTERGFQKQLNVLYKKYVKHPEKHTSRKLLSFDNVMSDEDDFTIHSFLPWEQNNYLHAIQSHIAHLNNIRKYETEKFQRRFLFDTFSSSLLHVARIYNKAFGYAARKVPAHMPHFVDKDIINEMQEKFLPYFDETSSHKIRHPQDMQFAFSYNYYLIGVKDIINITKIFDDVDTDHSGYLSDKELRSLAAFLYPIPLTLKNIHELEDSFKNCSKRIITINPIVTKKKHAYFDKSMPLVDRELFLNCSEVWNKFNLTSTKINRYNHELVGEDQVTFKMIKNNVSLVLAQLDSIRKERKKFICLNDDLDHSRADTKVIRNVLRDFYESMFPIPSQFELPRNYRNRFLYKDELLAWEREKQHGNLVFNFYISIVIFVLLTYLFRRKIFSLLRKLVSTYKRNSHVSKI